MNKFFVLNNCRYCNPAKMGIIIKNNSLPASERVSTVNTALDDSENNFISNYFNQHPMQCPVPTTVLDKKEVTNKGVERKNSAVIRSIFTSYHYAELIKNFKR